MSGDSTHPVEKYFLSYRSNDGSNMTKDIASVDPVPQVVIKIYTLPNHKERGAGGPCWCPTVSQRVSA